jgi:hypothetical protein
MHSATSVVLTVLMLRSRCEITAKGGEVQADAESMS